MKKTPCLIQRRRTNPFVPVAPVFGRRFLFGAAAVLAALTLSSLPALADEAPAAPAKSAAKTSGALPLQAAKGSRLRLPLPRGARYEVQDGSAPVRSETSDGYLDITPLEEGSVSLTINGVPYAVRVTASAQTTPSAGVAASAGAIAPAGSASPATTAPSTPAATAPSTPAATAPSTPATTAPSVEPNTTLPALQPTVPVASGGAPSSVPSGLAPIAPPVTPPQVSPSLPPPSRTPERPPFKATPAMPKSVPSSGVPIKMVTVTKGLASLLSFQRNILSVYFSDATVMDARAINARTLAVTGVGAGKSTLAVFTATASDDTVGQLHMFHITVAPPTSATPLPSPVDPVTIETSIRSAINDPRIQVTGVRTTEGGVAIRLTGRVRDAVEAKSAEDTARLFASNVINGIIVDKDAPSYDSAFQPPQTALTPEEVAQNQLRMITGNQTIELTPLGGSWVLKGEVASQAEAQQLLTLAGTLSQKIVPLLVVRGPSGLTPAEQPISSQEDREMTRRLQEVTGINTVYVIRTANNGAAIYGSVRNRLEFDRIQRYKNIIPVNQGGGGGDNQNVPTVHPTHAYQSPSNVQVFVRIEDPRESAMRLVTIDSNVVEISRTALKNLGVEFGSAQVLSESVTGGNTVRDAQGGVTVNPTITTRTIDPQFQAGTIQAGNGFAGSGGFGIIDAFRARLNAIYTQGNANILSKPNVTTLEGTEAQITIGGARPIPQIQSSGGGQGTIQENIIFRRFGVILTMRPTVLADDTIILQVRVDVTDLDSQTGITRGNTFIPGETVRSVNNVLVLKEGDIIALGGLITNIKRRATSKVPVLSQIPILGALFQSRRFENNESELAIFLTPTIKRIPVGPEGLENVVHPPSWPKLSGVGDGQAFDLSSVSGKTGTTTGG
jgi:Flp pilus assembly secretin CpaC